MVSETEIWKPVPGRPEFLASSMGRILRQPHYTPMHNGGFRAYAPKPTMGVETRSKKGAKHAYRNAVFRGVGNVKVHQLVCAAFHGEKPFDDAVVIHLDEDGVNNRPENLKWGTQKENLSAPGFREYLKTRQNPWEVHMQRRQQARARP